MLIRRGKTYHFRQWIPLDLRLTFDCKELVRSLKTTDRSQAKLSARLLEHEAERIFYLIRLGMLSYSQIDKIVEDFKVNTLERLSEERRESGATVYLPPHCRSQFINESPERLITEIVNRHKARIKSLAVNIQTNDYSDVTGLAEQLLIANKIDDPGSSKIFHNLCEHLLKAQIEISQTVVKRMQGDFGQSYYDAKPKPIIRGAAPKLSNLWESYRSIKLARGKWSDKTKDGYERFYAETVDVLGDKELSEYGQDDAVALLDALRVRANTASTVSGKVEFVSSLFKFALKTPESSDKWRVRGNPFSEMQIDGANNDPKEVKPYTPEDVSALISGLLDVRLLVEPHRFWVPLIALYSGMRQDEICQLRVEDVVTDDGVLVFRICHNIMLTVFRTGS